METNNKERITGKIFLKGKVQCLSPLHIGCGSGEHSDMDVLVDDNGYAFIPATSFGGVLRHSIDLERHPDINDNFVKNFWGFSKKKTGHQCSFHCSDLYSDKKPDIVIRDGIRIDNRTGLVEHNGKYDYEIVEPGSPFNLNMEFEYTNENKKFIKRMVRTIYQVLSESQIILGGKTNNGLGIVKLNDEDSKLYEFDFKDDANKKRNVFNYLTKKFDAVNIIKITDLGDPFPFKRKDVFSIEAVLKLQNSIIIRSYSSNPKEPDSVHIKSKGKYIIPGSSLKGAIRGRAERILNTLGKPEIIAKELFGFIPEEKKSDTIRTEKKIERAIKSKLLINEVELPEFVAEIQTRIKIDRFTGGTIESALFESMPLFIDFTEKVLKLEMTIQDYKDYEAGLLLLVLKDLWSGDLAVGGEKNVGRGVFNGKSAIIKINDDPVIENTDLNNLTKAEQDILQKYVTSLVKKEVGNES
ncbi:MAG: RAMP superfamily CRISPR-associated protein [Candidatus Zhuqueibacterota bacterium]